MIHNIKKVQEYFKLTDAGKTETDNIHWFYFKDIIPFEYIYDKRMDYCEKMEWDFNNADDTYDGKTGAIYWWNQKMIWDVLVWLRDLYPKENKGMQKLAEVMTSTFDAIERGEYKPEPRYGAYEERMRFYNSLDWAYVKYLRFHIDFGICQKCGIKPLIPEINHLYPITSEFYPELFIRNLDITRLETLCHDCHMIFHKYKENNDTHFV